MTTADGTTLSAAHELLFDDVLVCEELRPAAFVPGALDGVQLQSHLARGEALLRALAAVEDSARHDDSEQPADGALHRVEAKLDLLTALVASLARHEGADMPRALTWSAHGARMAVDAAVPVDTRGAFRVQPADWLPSTLVLPATVVASETDASGVPMVWLHFDSIPPALEAALERHLFRLHRRAVAESRRR